MKKITYLMASIAMLAAFSSCKKDNTGDVDFSQMMLDGFYAYGDATGSKDVLKQNAMAAGFNEVDKANRAGMYEKYIWLEAGKDFSLIEKEGDNKIFYGAELVEVNYGYDETDPDCKNFADNPNMKILQGRMIIGENAPKMQVKESAMYHIVLDNNKEGDLEYPQIILQKATWGVRGGMNSWGFTPGEETVNPDGTIVYTWKDQSLAKNGEFKFASCHGWKINLDEDGNVKAEVSFGDNNGLEVGAPNFKVEKAGLYDLTLTYKPSHGKLADSFSYEITLTQESTMPETMYINGNDFGGENWDWNSPNIVEMTPVHSHEGMFWAVRYMTTTTEFKFCAQKAWNGDFTQLGTNEGFITPGNNKVEADGIYTIIVDIPGDKITVMPAEVYGMGDCFGGWTEGANPFAAEGTVMKATLKADGNLRMYAKIPGNDGNWWQSEFNIYDGAIVYRATGGDQAAVTAGAGQTVELDFNAGTGSIK